MRNIINKVGTFMLYAVLVITAYLIMGLSALQSVEASSADIETAPVPSTPTSISPVDYVNSEEVVFIWQPDDVVDPVTYDLAIDSEIIRQDLLLDSVKLSGIPDGPHDWSVRSCYESICSDWSLPETFIKDTVSPVLNDEQLIYSCLDESQPSGLVSIEAQKILGRYVVVMGQDKFEDFRFNMLLGNLSEDVSDSNSSIFLKGLNTRQTTSLLSYFETAPYLSDQERSFYYDVIRGSEPIAYLFFNEANEAVLIDAYSYMYDGIIAPLVIPGDFPYDIYQFHGEMTDLAGNIGSIDFSIEFIREGMSLPAPIGFSAIASDGKVSLTWLPVKGAISYNLYYKLSTENNYTGPINLLNTEFEMTDLRNGYLYDFMITAVSSLDDSGESAIISATPVAPAVTPEVITPAVVAVVQTSKAPTFNKLTTSTTNIATSNTDTEITESIVDKSEENIPAIELPNGITKGEDSFNDEADAVNWTPWIVLILLILLAAAATGGYFYWFIGNETVSDVAVSKPEVSKTITKHSSEKLNHDSTDVQKLPPKRW